MPIAALVPRRVPLVFLQHFTGGLDHWDPAVTDGLGRGRPVILFDNAGGLSGGAVPPTIEAMAGHVAAFADALGLQRFDLLGFSMGGMVAQAYAKQHSDRLRRLILVGTGRAAATRRPTRPTSQNMRAATATSTISCFCFSDGRRRRSLRARHSGIAATSALPTSTRR
jgi:pimeloyl-ACP methyl ester carboxylesterase